MGLGILPNSDSLGRESLSSGEPNSEQSNIYIILPECEDVSIPAVTIGVHQGDIILDKIVSRRRCGASGYLHDIYPGLETAITSLRNIPEALVTPVSSPGVLNEPVGLVISHQEDSVVDAGASWAGDGSTCRGIVEPIVSGIDSDGERTIGD